MLALYQPAISALWYGQVVFVTLLALLVALRALQCERWDMAGIALALSLIKPQLSVLLIVALLGWAAWRRRWQIWRGFSAGCAALVLLALPLASTPRQVFGGGIQEHLVLFLPYTSTLWALLLWLFPGVWLLPVLACGALLVWFATRWLAVMGSEADERLLLGLVALAIPVNLLVLPYSWPYNNALLIFPTCYVLDRCWRKGPYPRLVGLRVHKGITSPG
jgi:hypothetical protein